MTIGRIISGKSYGRVCPGTVFVSTTDYGYLVRDSDGRVVLTALVWYGAEERKDRTEFYPDGEDV